jgi:hypothetical protein
MIFWTSLRRFANRKNSPRISWSNCEGNIFRARKVKHSGPSKSPSAGEDRPLFKKPGAPHASGHGCFQKALTIWSKAFI